MSINWWTDDENMLCLQREFHSSVKKDEFCKEKWKELENIIEWSKPGPEGKMLNVLSYVILALNSQSFMFNLEYLWR